MLNDAIERPLADKRKAGQEFCSHRGSHVNRRRWYMVASQAWYERAREGGS